MTARSHSRSRRKLIKRARARTLRYVQRAERRAGKKKFQW
jgi:hypothetical protein